MVWARLRAAKAKGRRGERTLPELAAPDRLNADIAAFHAVLTDHAIPQEAVQKAFPDHYMALGWYTSAHPASGKWYLEALLLTGLSLEEIAMRVDPSAPVLAVDVYKRAFFNVTRERRDNPGWMRQYIWAPSMCKTRVIYFHDFLLKLAGRYAGPDILDQMADPRMMTREAAEWVRGVAQDQRMRTVLMAGGEYSRLGPAEQVAVAEATLKEWATDAKAAGAAVLGDAAMDGLIKAVEGSIGVMRRGEQQPETYTFTSPMFEDGDTANKDADNDE